MKILWVHNFDTKKNINSGVFMYNQLLQLKMNDLQVELFCLNSKSLLQTLRDFIFLYKNSDKYDLIHAQYGSFVGFFTSFLPSKKIISLRGTDYYGTPKINLKNKVHNLISRFFTLNSLSRFNIIITMSDRMTGELRRKYPEKNIVTLTDGINLDSFNKINISKANKGPLRILFSSITNDNPIKRAYLGIEAVEILKKQNYNVELVTMTGIKHDEVPKFISNCDMVLLTSTHEGWPNVIKECLALNIPFVSTDVSDLSMISEVEHSCFVVNPEPEKIAGAIVSLMNIDRGELNLRKYIEHMDMKNYVRKLISIYQSEFGNYL